MKIAILGSTGMLGSQLLDYFKNTSYNVIAYGRDSIDSENISLESLKEKFSGVDYVINAIGIIKPYIHDDNATEVLRAINVNALFPHLLSKSVENTNTKVIQIATDCVYDGVNGGYNEADLHNATDVYGKTKSLGEVVSDNFINIRCSIIGKEEKGKLSFLEWFLNQENGTTINGYTNHFWNGITTLAFAKICHGIIQNKTDVKGVKHIIPSDILSKAEMLKIFAKVFNKNDINIVDIEASIAINRTLSTDFVQINDKLWTDAGYSNIPTIEEMIREL